MRVRIPSMLRSYTDNQKYVEIKGTTLFELLDNLNLRYEGIRFRFVDENNKIRPHMRVYVNGVLAENMKINLNETDEIFITQALSGGSSHF
ncbi:MAG: MoaD/ThiS family protein [Candidatus Heimdallarchaeota archaeon]|nr:MoaD/ThiS family protein [Candidatus Heimdallarchaeota archaeon]